MPSLDLLTLVVVLVFVTALTGGLLLFTWLQNREVQSLGWWSVSLLTAAFAFVLLVGRAILPDWLSVAVGNAVILLAVGFFWGGFRLFEGRTAPVLAVTAGALVWIAACGIPEFYKSFPARVILASLLLGAYYLAAAYEIWRGRAEALVSRYPIIALLLAHAAMTLVRYPTISALGHTSYAMVFTSQWVIAHVFEALLFTVSSAFLLLGITKERIEAEQRAIAARDPLTGMLNRRSFFEEARKILDRARRDKRSCALLLADIDHFKQVNDRFGHATGDDVLRGFANAAAASLPPGTVFARIGGEEFACIIGGADQERAYVIADALRTDFAAVRFEADREAFSATVSVGLATTDDFGHILDALLAGADVTLYMAKNGGRNRVGIVGPTEPPAIRTPAAKPIPLAA